MLPVLCPYCEHGQCQFHPVEMVAMEYPDIMYLYRRSITFWQNNMAFYQPRPIDDDLREPHCMDQQIAMVEAFLRQQQPEELNYRRENVENEEDEVNLGGFGFGNENGIEQIIDEDEREAEERSSEEEEEGEDPMDRMEEQNRNYRREQQFGGRGVGDERGR